MSDASHVRQLRDALQSKLVENAMKREFIPEDDFDRLMSRDTVCRVFEEIVFSNINLGRGYHPIDFRKWELVAEEYRKVLAVLVFIGHEHLIMSFLNHGRGDKNLPFYKEELEIIHHELTETQFSKKQYSFIAVKFKKGDEKYIPEEWILPFMRDTPIRKGEGGFGKIYEIEIHESYYDPNMWMFLEGERPHVFARKELMPDDYNDKHFAMENSALKILQAKCQHPNIVPLLACYKYGSQYSFLFPRAECDLYMYFEQTQPPQTIQETLSLFERISKLASALNEIHNCEIVLEADGRKIDFSQIGYHRDLKPKNVLKMGDVFMISDFGLARFKDNTSNSKTTWTWGFSTYSAPECQQGADVNRLADVWSLGCIFSEVVTFAILGMEGILEYSSLRVQPLTLHVSVNLFYEHGTDQVMDAVLGWFERLREESNRNQFILDILELVEKMLSHVSVRPRATDVMSEFSEILARERSRTNTMEDIPMAIIRMRQLVKSPEIITDIPGPAFTPPSPMQRIATFKTPAPPKKTTSRRDTLPELPQLTAATRKDIATSLAKDAISNRRKTLDLTINPYSRLRSSPFTVDDTPGASPMDRSNSEQRRPWTSEGSLMKRHVSNDPRSNVNVPQPLFYKVPGFLAKSQKGKSPFGYLKEFDTVFLIDDSESMSGQWDSVALALCRFLELATLYDSDGVDLHFMGSPECVSNARTVKAVFSIFRRVKPGGSTSISVSLDDLLSDYVSRFRVNRRTKRLNLIVITDGDITPLEDPSDVIVSCAMALDSVMAPKCQVGVQFALIGSSEIARRMFKDMDDNLWRRNDMRDMVDTTPYDPDMDGRDDETLLKIMCGAVNRLLDNKSDSGSL